MADFDPFADPADTAEAEEATAAEASAGTGGDSGAPAADPGPWGRALESEQEAIIFGGKIMALHTFAPGEKAKCGIIICGGGTQKSMGSATMDKPLITAVAKACSDEGIPRLRFDYVGSGRSAALATDEEVGIADGANNQPPDWITDQISSVLSYMLENLCQKVVLVGYSMGSQEGMKVVRRNKKVKCICSLNVGFEVWRRIFIPDETVKEKTRMMIQGIHKQGEHRTLYVIGENDTMTPEDQLRGFVRSRSDGGSGVTIEVVPGANHPFEGYEEEAAAKVIAWLREEICAS